MMKTTMLLAVVALASGSLASAQTSPMATKPTTPVTKPKAGQSGTPAMKTAIPTKPAPAMKTGSAVHTTPSGKKITYDCSKKGNMNKKACKA